MKHPATQIFARPLLITILLLLGCGSAPPKAQVAPPAQTPVAQPDPHPEAPKPAPQSPEPQAQTEHHLNQTDRAAIARQPFTLLDNPEMRGPNDLVVVAVGDVSQPATQWVEQVEALGAKAFEPTQRFVTGDINIMNLENPVTEAPPTARKEYAFTSPPHRLDWYADAGFNAFSLANNHIADADQPGIDATIQHLDALAKRRNMPIWHAGAGTTPEEGIAPKLIEIPGKDLKVALFSVGFSRNENVGKFYDESLIPRIKDAKKAAQIVMIAVHAGREYQHIPDPQLAARFRTWIDAGADLVIGHHPHVVQPVEVYKKGLIFYSLGNHVFASRTVRHRKFGARLYGMMARIVIHDGAVRGAHIVPTWVNNSDDWTADNGDVLPNAAFAPKPLTGPFADAFFADMATWTEKAGATPLERLGDMGVIEIPQTLDVASR